MKRLGKNYARNQRSKKALAPRPSMYGIRLRKFLSGGWLRRRELHEGIRDLHARLLKSKGSSALRRERRAAGDLS